MGARAVLIKGGHLHVSDDSVVDILYDGEFTEFSNPRIETTSTHGTGCTLSAAIAAHLALGAPLKEAVSEAIAFVHLALASAPGLGSGHGPLNHFAGERPDKLANERLKALRAREPLLPERRHEEPVRR